MKRELDTDRAIPRSESERDARRDFLRRTGKVAVAAPAAILLLRAQRTPAAAQGGYGGGPGKPSPRKK